MGNLKKPIRMVGMNTAAAIMSEPERECLSGEVIDIRWRDQESGRTILKVAVRGYREPVVMLGVTLAEVGEIVTAQGQWRTHPTHGRQFVADGILAERPSSARAIEKYLASGVIRGIGPSLAERIVAAFGDKTFEVLDKTPERLSEVKGIGKGRVAEIVRIWKQGELERKVLVRLAEYGIVGAIAMRVLRQYGGSAVDVVLNNPYRLAREVRGIGFKLADEIALRLGVPRDSRERIIAGIAHCIHVSTGMGNCGVPKEAFKQQAIELLGCDPNAVIGEIEEQAARRTFIVGVNLNGESVVFDRRLLDAEYRIARALRERVQKAAPWAITPEQAREIAIESERACKVELAPEQRQAVEMALLRSVSILTGGPGTGKTSTLKVILEALRRVRAKVILGAPTGKAAKRMRETTGMDAATVARLIGMGRGDTSEPVEINCDTLIIDEASMVDVRMLDDVLDALDARASILFVGDVDQLPSVAAGRVLGDMIDSGVIPTTRLTKVFRQAEASAIIRNAHRVNQGRDLEPQGDAPQDFYFIPAATPEATAAWVTKLVQEHIPERIGIPANNVQVLAPMRKGTNGTEALNAELQRILNPAPGAVVEKYGRRFCVGDRVLQTVNNYDLGVMNGESGIVVAIDTKAEMMTVNVDGTRVEYPFSELDQLDLAYAMTVHKSQGSQFDAVVIPLTMQHYMMLQRAILYTGITRAVRFCVVVGDPKAVRAAIENARTQPRITALQMLLERPDAIPGYKSRPKRKES